MITSESHLTPVDLDALELDALQPSEDLTPSEDRARRDAHLAACPSCARARAEHRADASHFSAQVFRRTLPRVHRRLQGSARRQRWLLVATVVAGSTAGLVLVPRLSRMAAGPAVGDAKTSERAAETSDVYLGSKGASALRLYARRNRQVFTVNDGAVLAPGDAIRFIVEPHGASHVIIGSVDGAGKASIYFPFGGARSVPVEPEQHLEVPGSIILDDAPGPEHVFAVFSRQPLESEPVRQALAALGARGAEAIRQARELPLRGTWQASVHFEKSAVRP